jgi:hypothetical protein
MKKLIILLGVLTVSLTSCLKDKPNVDFSNIGAFAEIVHAGTPYFGEASITDATDTISRTLQINVTGVYPPTNDVKVTVELDNSLVAKYAAIDATVPYLVMPAGSFVFTNTTVTIKAGTRLANLPVTFYKNKLDPTKSYMLPIKISNVTGAGQSANFSIKYYHFIGNDFAGTYQWQFTRTPSGGTNFTYAAGNTNTFLPNSATEFEVTGGYYTQTIRYKVDFQQVGLYPNATYSHFTVVIDPDDVTTILNGNNINVLTGASIIGYVEKDYTYTEALKLFDQGFTYDVLGTAAGSVSRHNVDQFKK